MQRSHVYILVYPNNGLLKIGKANDVFWRSNGLKKEWGEPDYENSYSLEMDVSQVFKIEKALHLFLSEHAAGLSEGDGKTEFFAIECLDQALEYLEVFIKRSERHILKKGIKVTEIAASKKLVDKQLRKYTIKQERLSALMNDTTKKLDFLMRIVGILQKYREQIKYHYKIDGNYVTLTLEDKRLKDLVIGNRNSIFALFFIDGGDFHKNGNARNTLDSSGGGDAMHSWKFLIRIHHTVYGNDDPLRDFLMEQYRHIILSLPDKSPAYIRAKQKNSPLIT